MITATENSINTAFIDMTLSMENGPEKIVDAANRLGIPPVRGPPARRRASRTSSPGLEPITGVALGSATVSPINMANAYATLANDGRAAEPYIIEKVVDRNGETRYQHKVSGSEAVDADIAADVTLRPAAGRRQPVGLGTRRWLAPVAGKTGTATNGEGEVSSAWFAGYTPQLSTAVMYVRGKGNEQLQGWLPSYFGGDYPAETWTAVMAACDGGAAGRGVPGAGLRRRRQRAGGGARALHPAADHAGTAADHPGAAADHRGADDRGADDRGADDRRADRPRADRPRSRPTETPPSVPAWRPRL